MPNKIVNAIFIFITIILIVISTNILAKIIYIEIWKTSPIPENKEIQLTENTIVFTVNLDDIICCIAESKTNGYIDLEIFCVRR